MANVFLHVGTMKSGTTYLQRACDLNADLLARSRIEWHGSTQTNDAVQNLLGSAMQMPGKDGAWAALARKISGSESDALISMELLGPAPQRVIRALGKSLAPHEPHLILTIRDLSQVVPSHWQETTQNRGSVGWDDYCASVCDDDDGTVSRFWRHHDVLQVVRNWSEIVPKERISIVTVPVSRDEPDLLWKRFASVLGVPDKPLRRPRGGNQSLGAPSAELMLRVNVAAADLDWPHYRWGIKLALGKRSLAPRAKDEPRYALAPEHHQFLRDKALRMVKQIEAAGLRVVGDLADIVPPGEPETSDFAPSQLTDSQLLDAAVAGLAGVGRVLGGLRLERDALRSQLDQLRAAGGETEREASGEATEREARVVTVRKIARRIPPLRWGVQKARALRARGR